MTIVISLDDEHVRSLERAKQALEGEKATAERWRVQTVEMALAIDDLAEILDRARTARKPRRQMPRFQLLAGRKDW